MNDTITRPIIAPISISAAGPNVIIPAQTDQYIYVRQLLLVADGGANLVTVQSDRNGTPTDLSYVPLAADSGFILENTAPDYPFLIDLKPGEALVLDLGSATSVKGHIIYGFRK